MIWMFYVYLILFALFYMSALRSEESEYESKLIMAKLFALYGGIVVGTITIISIFV